MKKRTIAVFTGNRSEYGLLRPVLDVIRGHPALDYMLLVSGAHLSESFGHSINEIEADGYEIFARIDIDCSHESTACTALAIADGVKKIALQLEIARPDIIVVYGDRFEAFSAAVAASQMSIAIAHIEGGDLTEGGALDDAIRHAITKLAHLHFATNIQAANRILAMGEESWRVYNVGLPALDLIYEGQFASPSEIVQKLDIRLSRPIIVFTQHSVTTEADSAAQQIKPSIEALVRHAENGAQIIITYPNNDAGSDRIIEAIRRLDHRRLEAVRVFKSLGRHLYHGILALARNESVRIVCVGNSSSGIKETPAFGCPTVNIGSRQRGRLRSSNVLDSTYDADEIFQKIDLCLYDETFRAIARSAENPYGKGSAGRQIADVVSQVPLGPELIQKKMTLVGESKEGWYR